MAFRKLKLYARFPAVDYMRENDIYLYVVSNCVSTFGPIEKLIVICTQNLGSDAHRDSATELEVYLGERYRRADTNWKAMERSGIVVANKWVKPEVVAVERESDILRLILEAPEDGVGNGRRISH